MPKRSVTRFFVPLIDVLILLFCMFLLLPFVARTDDGLADETTERLKQTADDLAVQKAQVEKLMAERQNLADRTVVRILEIDGDTGAVTYFNTDGPRPRREEVTDRNVADVIARAKQLAGDKQPLFVVLCPREEKRYPDQPQLNKLRTEWFRGQNLQIDNPFARGK